jgi:hypothetical protein
MERFSHGGRTAIADNEHDLVLVASANQLTELVIFFYAIL